MIESEVLKDFQKLSLLLEQKDNRIAELEEKLANSIRPKFPRQEHICSFAFCMVKNF